MIFQNEINSLYVCEIHMNIHTDFASNLYRQNNKEISNLTFLSLDI